MDRADALRRGDRSGVSVLDMLSLKGLLDMHKENAKYAMGYVNLEFRNVTELEICDS